MNQAKRSRYSLLYGGIWFVEKVGLLAVTATEDMGRLTRNGGKREQQQLCPCLLPQIGDMMIEKLLSIAAKLSTLNAEN